MRALKNVWTTQHGRHSVVGLAPSAAAAQVLAKDLGIDCENTAKCLYEYSHGRAAFTKDQLVIIDEATLAGTLTLDRITEHAAMAGAKVLFVGDWAQLQSVEAGGAFAMLVDARDDVPELVDIHRFAHEWEKATSLALRHGQPEAVDAYLRPTRHRRALWPSRRAAAGPRRLRRPGNARPGARGSAEKAGIVTPPPHDRDDAPRPASRDRPRPARRGSAAWARHHRGPPGPGPAGTAGRCRSSERRTRSPGTPTG